MIDMNYEIESARRYFASEAARWNLVPTSRIFIVMDHGGGWRFVITEYREIKYHLGQGEFFIKVPRVRIYEPVGWDDIPRTIRLAERYATQWLVRHGYNHIPDPRMEVLQ